MAKFIFNALILWPDHTAQFHVCQISNNPRIKHQLYELFCCRNSGLWLRGCPRHFGISFGGHAEVLDKRKICRLPRDGYAQLVCQTNAIVASEYLEQLVGA
eukprot:7842754-Pyramimonas_sp.AAC.1